MFIFVLLNTNIRDMSKFKNPIKWSGSKSPVASEIISHFPNDISTYYEPFFGSGGVLFELLTNSEWKEKRKNIIGYRCSDINKDLVDLWNKIREKPDYLIMWYQFFWDRFNSTLKHQYLNVDKTELYQTRKDTFNNVRKLYNSEGLFSEKFVLLLFLTRTAFNGLLRFNNKGEYNSTCHFSRPGIHPDKIEVIIKETSQLLNDFNVEFIHEDYLNIKPLKGDFVFLDPPYSGSNDNKMYFGTINENELINWCNNLPCKYALTYDGERNDKPAKRLSLQNVDIILLKDNNSSYSRMNGKKVIVNELLYIKK
jgi:DNA adenine methylase